MQTMTNSFRSLSLIWELHRDTFIFSVSIAIGLGIGAGVGTFFLHAF